MNSHSSFPKPDGTQPSKWRNVSLTDCAQIARRLRSRLVSVPPSIPKTETPSSGCWRRLTTTSTKTSAASCPTLLSHQRAGDPKTRLKRPARTLALRLTNLCSSAELLRLFVSGGSVTRDAGLPFDLTPLFSAPLSTSPSGLSGQQRFFCVQRGTSGWEAAWKRCPWCDSDPV